MYVVSCKTDGGELETYDGGHIKTYIDKKGEVHVEGDDEEENKNWLNFNKLIIILQKWID